MIVTNLIESLIHFHAGASTPLSQLCILHFPYFCKIYKFPYFRLLYVFCLIYVFRSPYSDHDVGLFMHHALHVQDAHAFVKCYTCWDFGIWEYAACYCRSSEYRIDATLARSLRLCATSCLVPPVPQPIGRSPERSSLRHNRRLRLHRGHAGCRLWPHSG